MDGWMPSTWYFLVSQICFTRVSDLFQTLGCGPSQSWKRKQTMEQDEEKHTTKRDKEEIITRTT